MSSVITQAQDKKNMNCSKITKQELTFTEEWDKVFPKSEKVDNHKITFVNRYGITLVADMYKPKNVSGKLPALAVSGPFGAVKEQVSGRYAQAMAERGFLTIAFDPSFTGESGGNPRRIASPDINTEDFMAAVDYLCTNPDVDNERIGIIGICGWGGMALNTAALDTRVKATVTVTMYDMSRVFANEYFDAGDSEEKRYATKSILCCQRTKDYTQGYYEQGGGVATPTEESPQFAKDYYDFYKTPRGYHQRSGASTDGWTVTGCMSFINQPILQYTKEIRSAVLMIHGEKAHSRYFSEDAYRDMTSYTKYRDNKQLLIVPDACHVDLYDNLSMIPFDKIDEFFNTYLK